MIARIALRGRGGYRHTWIWYVLEHFAPPKRNLALPFKSEVDETSRLYLTEGSSLAVYPSVSKIFHRHDRVYSTCCCDRLTRATVGDFVTLRLDDHHVDPFQRLCLSEVGLLAVLCSGHSVILDLLSVSRFRTPGSGLNARHRALSAVPAFT